MFAVIEILDKQYLIKEGEIFTIDGTIEEKKVIFDKVLFIKTDKKIDIGKPYVKAIIEAEVLETGKREKDIVFKFKRKTGYKVTRGHRQNSTVLKIKKIKLGE